jgi:pyruvate formate lyase activating enzyme
VRDNCTRCGACAEACLTGALEVVGKETTVAEAIEEVLRDKPFYETSGGGMTVSGGEPMFQFEFTRALLRTAKEHGLHTCLDTSGIAPLERYLELLDLVDLFLWDYKETDPQKHKEYTGVERAPILEKLRRLDEAGARFVLRCPIIPGLNARDDHFDGIIAVANEASNIEHVDLEPYNPLGRSKNERVGKENAMGDQSFPEDEEIDRWVAYVSARCNVPVRRG